MRRVFARIHNGLAWLIFAGAIVQIALISMAYFEAFEVGVHAGTGFLIEFLALLTLISALIVRANRWNVILSLALFLLLFPVQPLLAYGDLPEVVKGLHGLNGMLIMGLAYTLATSRIKATTYEEEATKPVAEPTAAD